MIMIGWSENSESASRLLAALLKDEAGRPLFPVLYAYARDAALDDAGHLSVNFQSHLRNRIDRL